MKDKKWFKIVIFTDVITRVRQQYLEYKHEQYNKFDHRIHMGPSMKQFLVKHIHIQRDMQISVNN